MKVLFFCLIFIFSNSVTGTINQSRAGYDSRVNGYKTQITQLKQANQKLGAEYSKYIACRNKKSENNSCSHGAITNTSRIQANEAKIKTLQEQITSTEDQKKQLDDYDKVQKETQKAITQASAKNKVDKSNDMTTLVAVANVGMGIYLLPNCSGFSPNWVGCAMSMVSFAQAARTLSQKSELSNVSNNLSGLRGQFGNNPYASPGGVRPLSPTDCKTTLKQYISDAKELEEACNVTAKINAPIINNLGAPSGPKGPAGSGLNNQQLLSFLNKKVCPDITQDCPKVAWKDNKFEITDSKGLQLIEEDLENVDPALKKQAEKSAQDYQAKNKKLFKAITNLDKSIDSSQASGDGSGLNGSGLNGEDDDGTSGSFGNQGNGLTSVAGASGSGGASDLTLEEEEEEDSVNSKKKRIFRNLSEQFNSNRKKKLKNQKSVMAGNDVVGTMQDNIFLMIHRRYLERNQKKQFIIEKLKKILPKSFLLFPATS